MTQKRLEQPAETLEQLSRQIVDTRNQLIKATNALGNLTAEVREIQRHHNRQRRGLTINSIGAYAIFVLLVGGCAYLVAVSRIDRIASEKNTLARQHAATRVKLTQMRDKRRRRQRAEEAALRFYKLMKQRQIHKAIARYPKIANLPLTKVENALFASWVERKRASLAYNAYAAGMRAINEQQWKQARIEFRRSLDLVPRPPHAAPLYYYLGIAELKLGSYRAASDALEQAVTARADKLVTSQVRYHLGSAYELQGKRSKARAAYRAYLSRHPSGSHARLARRKIKLLSSD